MKKLISILLILILILPSCSQINSVTEKLKNVSSQRKEAISSKVSSQNLSNNTSNIFDVKTREDLSNKLGCSEEELDDILIYSTHLSKILPSINDEAKTSFDRGQNDEGITWVSKEELKTVISPVIITKDNWKGFFVPVMEEIESISFDENDNEVSEIIEEPTISIMPGYHYSWDKFNLELTDNVTKENFEFSTYWPQQIEEENGIFYTLGFGESSKEIRKEFNPDDYTCTKANGVIYKYEISEDLLCIDTEDGETVMLSDFDGKYKQSETMVLVRDENGEDCYVGYEGLGDYVFD